MDDVFGFVGLPPHDLTKEDASPRNTRAYTDMEPEVTRCTSSTNWSAPHSLVIDALSIGCFSSIFDASVQCVNCGTFS